jgi:hypothetical protein
LLLVVREQEMPLAKLNRYREAYAEIAKEIPHPEYTDHIDSNTRTFFDADESDDMEHYTGCTDWPSMKAAVFAIEAVRNMNAGRDFEHRAVKLLKMALEEMRRVEKEFAS